LKGPGFKPRRNYRQFTVGLSHCGMLSSQEKVSQHSACVVSRKYAPYDRVGNLNSSVLPCVPRGELYSLTPNCQNKNEYMSVNSSICLVTGFPAPCPAFDSMRNRIGRAWLLPF
jgi:hypothetical protein